MMQFNQTTYDFLFRFIDVCGLFFDAALIVFLVNHYFSLRRSNLKHACLNSILTQRNVLSNT